MDSDHALLALINRVSDSNKPVSVSWDETQQWQSGVFERFVAAGLLEKDVNTQSLQCIGCEHHCLMQVDLAIENRRAFIVCDHPDMQDQMGRINVPVERLQQWEVSAKRFAMVIAKLLGLDGKPVYLESAANYKLGMLSGSHGRRWVLLNAQPLTLEINRHTIPLNDLLYFSNEELTIDRLRVDEILDSVQRALEKSYTPDVGKREARKLVTQAMHQDWQDKYLALVKKHPNKTDTWYAMRISKLKIAHGRESETIRRNMKK